VSNIIDLKAFQRQTIPDFYNELNSEDLIQRIKNAKKKLGAKLIILAHHYQRNEIVELADEVGDSLELARKVGNYSEVENIVFCGVHFMAETADILTQDSQKVFLPDTSAGCPMADMANIKDVKIAWEKFLKIFTKPILPITYVNSSAKVKEFVGKNGGLTITSGNAEKILANALKQDKLIFFLPDQHLGRNTAVSLGVSLEQIALWKQTESSLDYYGDLQTLKIILWDGYCSVHQQFTPVQIERMRKLLPGIKIIVHPECRREVVELADYYGSTAKIIRVVQSLQKGDRIAIGTDNNLVSRLHEKMKESEIFVHFLNPMACTCQTMNRIDLPHLAWVLDELQDGKLKNQIKVPKETAKWAKVALDKMLQIK